MNASCCDDRIRSARRGFTLIELLVVIAIITLLVGILVPSLRSVKVMARQIKCLSNTRTIGQALLAYANSNDAYLPAVRRSEALDYTVQAYVPPGADDYEGPEGVGLLHKSKYQKGPDAYYCPGRDTDSDPFAVHSDAKYWPVPMAGDESVRTSYFVATSSFRTGGGGGGDSIDFSRWNNIEMTHPTKALVFEACVKHNGKPYGTSGHRHDMGYNFFFFDGTGRWVPDILKGKKDGEPKTMRNHLESTYSLDSVLPWEDSDNNLIYFIMTRYFAWVNHYKHEIKR